MLLTTDGPDHLNLKERYTHTLRRLLKEKTPSYGRCGGIHRLLEETTARPVLIHRPRAGRTWVWSDLHLGDTEVMEYCRRPFGDADAMGRAIMAAWTAAVEPDDTILNGGDIALSSALGKTRRTAIREAPGRKLLVVGNHDFNLRSGLLDTAGHDTWTGVLVIETDPPIVMTHVPMGMLPPGWVNLHGHVHNHAPPGDTPHINVCVEHTDYRPLPLGSLVTLAKHLLAGDVDRPVGRETWRRSRDTARDTRPDHSPAPRRRCDPATPGRTPVRARERRHGTPATRAELIGS